MYMWPHMLLLNMADEPLLVAEFLYIYLIQNSKYMSCSWLQMFYVRSVGFSANFLGSIVISFLFWDNQGMLLYGLNQGQPNLYRDPYRSAVGLVRYWFRKEWNGRFISVRQVINLSLVPLWTVQFGVVHGIFLKYQPTRASSTLVWFGMGWTG